MDWKELSKKHFASECTTLSAIVICCVVSIIGELCAANNRILLEVPNYDSISLVIIQIQATVQTLSIALLALASGYAADSHILERMIPDDKALSFYHRFIRNSDAKPRLIRFYQLLGKDNYEHTSGMLLRALEKLLKETIKRSQISDAEKMQRAYDADGGRPAALHNARKRIQEHLERTFSGFLFEGTGQEAYVKIRACSAYNPTDWGIEKLVEEHLSLWSRTLIEGLCDALKRLGAVYVRSSRDFLDDQQLIKYLENEAFAEFIGSENVFRTKEFRNRALITDILKSKTCIPDDYTQCALLLKKAGIRIRIQNVRIGVHPAVMRDRSVRQKGSSYQFSPIDGIELDFSKEELEKFLHDSRKVYDILYEVTIRREAGIIGDVFYSD